MKNLLLIKSPVKSTMQNQLVNGAIKSLRQALHDNICKRLSCLSQQSYLSPCLSVDIALRKFSAGRSVPLILPGGGLEKFQGRFKEEQYFNANDHMLLAQMQKTGYRFKYENNNNNSNWREYERMSSGCTTIIALRQTGMLNRNRNIAEESFFLQEQKSLFDRILEILKRIAFNRNTPPYSHGSPFGPYYHQNVMQPQSEKERKEDEETKNDDDGSSPPKDNEETTSEQNAESSSEDEKTNEGNDFENQNQNQWQSTSEQSEQDHSNHGNNQNNGEK